MFVQVKYIANIYQIIYILIIVIIINEFTFTILQKEMSIISFLIIPFSLLFHISLILHNPFEFQLTI